MNMFGNIDFRFPSFGTVLGPRNYLATENVICYYSDGLKLQDMKFRIKMAVLLAECIKFRHFFHYACKFRNKYAENLAT